MAKICLIFVLFSCLNIWAQAQYEYESLENNSVFTFQNRGDGGFLTAINVRKPYPPIVTDKWRDAATQKWRGQKAYFVNAFRFKPISDEKRVMNLDMRVGALNQDSEGFGLSNTQYWRIKYVGQGFSVIMSYKNGECMHSKGPGRQIGISPCTGSRKQQWAIRQI